MRKTQRTRIADLAAAGWELFKGHRPLAVGAAGPLDSTTVASRELSEEHLRLAVGADGPLDYSSPHQLDRL